MAVVPFDVAPVTTRQEVRAGLSTTIAFNVKNRVAGATSALVTTQSNGGDLPWVRVLGAAERRFAVEANEQVLVEVAPPDGTPTREAVVQLRVTRIDSVEDEFAESAPVTIAIHEIVRLPIPPRRWPFVVAAVIAALVIVTIIVWVATAKQSLGGHCVDDANCKDGLSCSMVGQSRFCLGNLGHACSSDGECVSARCTDVCVSKGQGGPPTSVDPAIEAIRELWRALPRNPSPNCPLDYDFSPPGIRGIYCRVVAVMDYGMLQARLSMPIYRNRVHSPTALTLDAGDFGYYNPAFVQWIVDNGVPGATDEELRRMSQPVYDQFIRVAARLFYYTKRMIDESGHRDEFIRASRELTGNPGAHQPELRRQFYSLIPQEMYDEPIARIAEIAMLFWLRRAIDGTEPLFFEGIQKVLRTYDAPWLEEASRAPPAHMPQLARRWFRPN